jgi:glycosyltransferase involved in cell wall biosynthesis
MVNQVVQGELQEIVSTHQALDGSLRSLRVGLVHDYLTQYGGAERVLESLHRLFPDAPVLTSMVDQAALPDSFGAWDLRETWLARLPAASKLHRSFLPLYPGAFQDLGTGMEELDVVIADSSAWAHHIGVSDRTALICYCHSPARFLYSDPHYLKPAALPPGVRQASGLAFARLRRKDQEAARRVDRYIANSRNVALRIQQAYGRRATVVYPPVDVERIMKASAGVDVEPWYLVVSRLVPHKRVDLAIDACTRYQLPLKVIGGGRALGRLQRQAGSTVEFLGQCSDDEVADHLRRCRALLLPGLEDFGMTAVEAQAAGRPVIAFAGGGALESVLPGETGVLFTEPTVESLMEAIDWFERQRWEPERARANALRFSERRFHTEMLEEIKAGIAARARKFASGPAGSQRVDPGTKQVPSFNE